MANAANEPPVNENVTLDPIALDPTDLILMDQPEATPLEGDRVVNERYVLQMREEDFRVASAVSSKTYEFLSAGMDEAAISIEALEVVADYFALWEGEVEPSDRPAQSFRDALTEAQGYFAAIDGLVEGTHH
ncbi:MAG: hypothetical protein MH825_09915 [Cyanobacteria bacterium]|nr:hypothetical protein [Cyanobacteriota bacterium]